VKIDMVIGPCTNRLRLGFEVKAEVVIDPCIVKIEMVIIPL